ncbi:DNA-directed RNA polymerase II subunit RPB1-like isoform X3 [Scomber scombrus]|uniref:DNA-directed RNA polymerase II subunit RPB1-like isoform X3 n=1 Tax=Scomber scombrus TaxID=13677 RepID=A0AAV1NUF0_SCOSC
MAALFSLGALLLVLLTGESYSYPAKQAPGFEASKFASAPAHHQTAPAGGSNYHQPSVQREPAAASYSSNFFAGSPSSFLAGSAQPSSFLPGQSQGNWRHHLTVNGSFQLLGPHKV